MRHSESAFHPFNEMREENQLPELFVRATDAAVSASVEI
jgi:hypothetical protein